MYSKGGSNAMPRYETTLNHFRLKATVGKLMDEDLVSLDKWLVQPKNDRPAANP